MKLTKGPFCDPPDSILCNKSYFCKNFFNITRQCMIIFTLSPDLRYQYVD